MIEYKKISEKNIWLVVKEYHVIPRRTEYIGAYWHEEEARKEAAYNIPNSGQAFTISLTEVILHGLMVDIK